MKKKGDDAYDGSDFWDALAPFHASIENNYLDLPSLERIVDEVCEPVLVVGAGQGLIVEALKKRGLKVDGVDISTEMIRYAKIRRNISIVHGDARALPFARDSYDTIIFATGVVDFMDDESAVQEMFNEARRILPPSGKLFVAFYRLSVPLESLLTKLRLLKNNKAAFREMLSLHQMTPFQTVAWASQRINLSYSRTIGLLLKSWFLSTAKEKRAARAMNRIFKKISRADALINVAPLNQPYRNEGEIRKLFSRLSLSIRSIEATESCFIVRCDLSATN